MLQRCFSDTLFLYLFVYYKNLNFIEIGIDSKLELFDIIELLKLIVAKNHLIDTIRYFEDGIRDSVLQEAALALVGNDVSHSASDPARAWGPAGPVRRCVFNYSIIHPAIHHQPSVKFILFLCIGPLQFAAPCINLLLVAICLARAVSKSHCVDLSNRARICS